MLIVQSTTLNDIQLEVFGRVQGAIRLLPIKYDAKDFKHGDLPFAELIIAPMDTQIDTVDGGDLLQGFILANMNAPKNYGANWAAIEGQKFIDLFPRDLMLTHFRITRTGTIKSPLPRGDDWQFTPVLIEYEANSCQIE